MMRAADRAAGQATVLRQHGVERDGLRGRNSKSKRTELWGTRPAVEIRGVG